jgi:hypothetical protein
MTFPTADLQENKKKRKYIVHHGAGTAQLVRRLRFELANREIAARSQTRPKDTSSTKITRQVLESTADFSATHDRGPLP